MRMQSVFGIVGAAAVTLACGGSEGAATCDAKACGGDVVGVWTVDHTCIDVSALNPFNEPQCGDALRSSNTSITGSYEFRDDGSMHEDFEMTVDMTIGLADACLAAIGVPSPYSEACSSLGESMTNKASDPSSTFASASCAYSTGQCSCNMHSKPRQVTGDDTYTVEGTNLVDSSGEPAAYCVQGDTLTLTATSSSNGVQGTLVMKKQK